MSGVSIGNGVIVGAGSVVTRHVNPFTIVAGNPARLIGNRFNSDQVKALEEIQWWYWDDATIKSRIEYFYLKVDDFIAIFNK